MKTDIFENENSSRENLIEKILSSKAEDVFDIQDADIPAPEFAKRLDSIICYNCGEPTMETIMRKHEDVMLCMPCYEEAVKKG